MDDIRSGAVLILRDGKLHHPVYKVSIAVITDEDYSRRVKVNALCLHGFSVSLFIRPSLRERGGATLADVEIVRQHLA